MEFPETSFVLESLQSKNVHIKVIGVNAGTDFFFVHWKNAWPKTIHEDALQFFRYLFTVLNCLDE